MSYTVRLTYFREGGKYYSDSEYRTDTQDLGDIFVEVRNMLAAGKRPGLIDGANEFYTLIEVPGHPHEHPRLVPLASQIATADLLDALKALIGEFNVCLQADDRMCVGCGCLQLQRRGEPHSRKHLPGCKLGQAETAVAKAEGRV